MFPIFLNLRGKRCLVVGGGVVGVRKVKSLLEDGARACVVSPTVVPELERMAAQRVIELHRRTVEKNDLKGAALVFCATNDQRVSDQVVGWAREQGLLVNCADNPENCDFYLGSTVRRGAIILAISTSGQSPALARAIRLRVESVIPPEYQHAATVLGEARSMVSRRISDQSVRKEFWDRLVTLLINLAERGAQSDEMRKALVTFLKAYDS